MKSEAKFLFVGWSAAIAAIILAVWLRIVALDSNPYPRLSWSSGLLTDEGFYIHNARNLVLFGTERTDDFNNMVIMPTLHAVQVGVFTVWGPGITQARLISVVCSLLGIFVLFAATRRAFGLNVAAAVALFVGLDHVSLLYNRMALMDTPGEMLLIFALYAWIRGVDADSNVNAASVWMSACGAILGVAFITRGLAAIAIPGAFAAAATIGSARSKLGEDTASDTTQQRHVGTIIPLAVGLIASLCAYAVCWYLPHRPEISRVSGYYLWHQLAPHSPQQVILNIANAWLGDERGAAPFLARHTPVQFALALLWSLYLFLRRKSESTANDPADPPRVSFTGSAAAFPMWWLGFAALFVSFGSYSPSRYYLLFYPALAIAAAFTLVHFKAVCGTILTSRTAVFVLGAYSAYHVGLAMFHHDSVGAAICVGITAVGGGVAVTLIREAAVGSVRRFIEHESAGVIIALGCWAVVNGLYLTDWCVHLSYEQRDAGRWLAKNLPKNAVLIGDCAPGLCMNNSFRVAPVISGLCNDQQPVERYRGSPRYLVILDDADKERWWTTHYPSLVAADRRMALFRGVERFSVGVYPVPDSQ